MSFCPFMSTHSEKISCSSSCALYKSGKCSIKILVEISEASARAESDIATTLEVMQLDSRLK